MNMERIRDYVLIVLVILVFVTFIWELSMVIYVLHLNPSDLDILVGLFLPLEIVLITVLLASIHSSIKAMHREQAEE